MCDGHRPLARSGVVRFAHGELQPGPDFPDRAVLPQVRLRDQRGG